MTIEIKVPSVGESVTEALLAEWFKQDGDSVEKNEPLFVIETDKVTLEVEAEAAGQLKILVGEGETVAIGTVVGEIDTAVAGDTAPEAAKEPEAEADAKQPEPEAEAQPPEAAKEKTPAEPPKDTPPPEADKEAAAPETQPLSPAVRRLVAENNLDPAKVNGTGPGGRGRRCPPKAAKASVARP